MQIRVGHWLIMDVTFVFTIDGISLFALILTFEIFPHPNLLRASKIVTDSKGEKASQRTTPDMVVLRTCTYVVLDKLEHTYAYNARNHMRTCICTLTRVHFHKA